MKKVDIDKLQVGQTLTGNIISTYSYQLLVAKGTVLTQEHMVKLRQFKEKGLDLIMEADLQGIRVNVLDQADKKVKRAFLDMFFAGKSIFENLSRGNPINIELAHEAVDLLVDQIMLNNNLLLQLAAVRVIDDYTFSHMVNVSIYAASFAKYLNYGPDDIRDFCLAGLLHDVGKARLPVEILRKKEALSPEEFAIVKRHSEYGYEELLKTDVSQSVREVALQHHERADGSGYPYGLRREEISNFSQIIAITDMYDALTSDRCYRSRILPHESADVIMGYSAMEKLDTELVRIFFKNIVLYPLGAEVILSDGRRARVVDIHPDFPLRPILETIEQNEMGNWLVSDRVDLLIQPTLFIEKILH